MLVIPELSRVGNLECEDVLGCALFTVATNIASAQSLPRLHLGLAWLGVTSTDQVSVPGSLSCV